jgi:hypothetical protein
MNHRPLAAGWLTTFSFCRVAPLALRPRISASLPLAKVSSKRYDSPSGTSFVSKSIPVEHQPVTVVGVVSSPTGPATRTRDRQGDFAFLPVVFSPRPPRVQPDQYIKSCRGGKIFRKIFSNPSEKNALCFAMNVSQVES